MDTPKQPYALYFSECRFKTTDVPHKISVTLTDVVAHKATQEGLTIEFNDEIACHYALELLGLEWQQVSATTLFCPLVKDLGYKVQSLYFETVVIKSLT